MCGCRFAANSSGDQQAHADRHCLPCRAASTVHSHTQRQVPGADGVLRKMTVVPVIAFASFDNPECKKVTGIKDGYRQMAMFCSRCVACMVTGVCRPPLNHPTDACVWRPA